MWVETDELVLVKVLLLAGGEHGESRESLEACRRPEPTLFKMIGQNLAVQLLTYGVHRSLVTCIVACSGRLVFYTFNGNPLSRLL